MNIRISLTRKLLLFGTALTIIPMGIAIGVITWQNGKMVESADEGCTSLASADLNHIALNIYSMCEVHHTELLKQVQSGLNVARNQLESAGGVSLSSHETVTWTAINQYTKESTESKIPQMLVGQDAVVFSDSFDQKHAVVDPTQQLVGGTCTLFQRMNEAGDMLRVSTNVKKLDGKRAIGTYIPATNPDGKPNPVVSTLLRGETYQGRAYVVNQWYITVYEPILDGAGNVVGALYFGVAQEEDKVLREVIMNTPVGETGYVFVLNAKDGDKGRYVISKDGKRDGEIILKAKDANGVEFIKEICEKAEKLGPGDLDKQVYPWKNAGDKEARDKVAHLAYFEPWDWVIGASSYLDEFYGARDGVRSASETCMQIILGVSLIALVVSCFVWLIVAKKIGNKVGMVADRLRLASQQVTAGADQLASAGQSLAQGSNEQAAAIEETSACLSEVSDKTHESESSANQAMSLMRNTENDVSTGKEAMTRLNEAIHSINDASDETAAIVRTIDEIAFQTNLLALNAAVEAARAGDAGRGFAVVAEEVRALAQRASEAAKQTSTLIEKSCQSAEHGVNVSQEASHSFDAIIGSTHKIASLLREIEAGAGEQTSGIDQINKAVLQMQDVTQAIAASSEESASAAEELSAQASEMDAMVTVLEGIVNGHAQGGGDNGSTYFAEEDAQDYNSSTSGPLAKPPSRSKQNTLGTHF